VSRRGWLAFGALSAIWGVPYLLIKIAVDHGVPPSVLAWGRVTLAAVVLLALAGRAGTLRTLAGRWRWIVAYGIAEIAIPFPLIAFGERRLPSSLTAILIACAPLLITLISWRLDAGERPTPLRMAGLLIGFAGVIELVGVNVASHPGQLLGTLAVLGAAVGYSIGPMIIKYQLADLDPRAAMGASLGVAAVVLTPLAALDAHSAAPTAGALAAVVTLGLLCTALAFVILSVLVAEVGPSRGSVITYINPVVAFALGVTLLGEQPSVGAVAGLLLILSGSWLSTDGRLPPAMRGLTRRHRSAGREDADSRATYTRHLAA
jgi:drug/metabolite transporter (DMT)-like permease